MGALRQKQICRSLKPPTPCKFQTRAEVEDRPLPCPDPGSTGEQSLVLHFSSDPRKGETRRHKHHCKMRKNRHVFVSSTEVNDQRRNNSDPHQSSLFSRHLLRIHEAQHNPPAFRLQSSFSRLSLLSSELRVLMLKKAYWSHFLYPGPKGRAKSWVNTEALSRSACQVTHYPVRSLPTQISVCSSQILGSLQSPMSISRRSSGM